MIDGSEQGTGGSIRERRNPFRFEELRRSSSMEAVRKPLLLFAGFSIERFTIVRGADVVPPRFAGSRIHSVLSPRPQKVSVNRPSILCFFGITRVCQLNS